MITEQAIQQTIERLRRRKDFERYGPVVVGLRVLLEEQDAIEEAEEKNHRKIINEIGQY